MRVVLVDDVITSGTSVREAIALLQDTARVQISGVVVAVDRQERGHSGLTMVAELTRELSVPVRPIVTIREIVSYLHDHDVSGRRLVDDTRLAAVEAHLAEHGAR